MKLKILSWNSVATWMWNIPTEEEKCTICQFPFESPCPRCKVPGDDCVPVQGQCKHHFHLHCIIKWTDEGSSDECPLCREKWQPKH